MKYKKLRHQLLFNLLYDSSSKFTFLPVHRLKHIYKSCFSFLITAFPFFFLMVLFTFFSFNSYAQKKSSVYVSLNSVSKGFVGYEYRFSNRVTAGLEVGYVAAMMKEWSYYSFPETAVRMLNTRGIQMKLGCYLVTNDSRNLFGLRPEFNYQRSFLFYDERLEFYQVYYNTGIMFTYAHRYNKSGRFCFFSNGGIKNMYIKRTYTRDKDNSSGRIEWLKETWPIGEIGIRFYFTKLNHPGLK